jgi:hypothetical protein
MTEKVKKKNNIFNISKSLTSVQTRWVTQKETVNVFPSCDIKINWKILTVRIQKNDDSDEQGG